MFNRPHSSPNSQTTCQKQKGDSDVSTHPLQGNSDFALIRHAVASARTQVQAHRAKSWVDPAAPISFQL